MEYVVQVEDYPINFSIYFLQPLPRFGGVVEVEVYPSNFNWRRHGRGGGEVW